jgi:hypothetical protein
VTLSLLMMVPTRWRRDNCERLLKSFTEATDNADLVFITDADDQDTYQDMDWGPAANEIIDSGGARIGTTVKVNHITGMHADDFDAFGYIGDDHLFTTPHWDTMLLAQLESMGGTGMVFGDDKRRNDIPETVIITSDIVKELGHFAEPTLAHYYIDNVWAELGGRANLIRYCPDVVLEHLHYQVNKSVEHDQTYCSAEDLWGTSDMEAFYAWRENVMPFEAARLRRRFSKDLDWLFSRI